MAAPYPTREDFFQLGARELLVRSSLRPPGKRVTAAAVYTVGTNVNSALAGCAAMADEVMRHAAIRLGELYLDSAEGDALERVIVDRIAPDLTRKQPGLASVELTISRVASPQSSAALVFGSGAIVRASSGAEFQLLTDVTFASNVLGNVTVTAEALVVGTGGNVPASTITQFAETPSDTGISVTNLADAAGGSDVESDRDYVTRAKLELASRARGTAGSIESAILRVSGIKWAIVDEMLDSGGDPNGVLKIFVADVNGHSNSAMIEKARIAANSVRTAGMIPDYVGVSPIVQTISYALSFDVGTNVVVARQQLKSLTVSLVNELAPNETLTRSMLFSVARAIPGAIVTDAAVVLPSADYTPDIGKKVTTNLSSVLVNGA